MADFNVVNKKISTKNLTFSSRCYILVHCAAKLMVNTGFAAAILPFAAKYTLTKAGLAIGPKRLEQTGVYLGGIGCRQSQTA